MTRFFVCLQKLKLELLELNVVQLEWILVSSDFTDSSELTWHISKLEMLLRYRIYSQKISQKFFFRCQICLIWTDIFPSKTLLVGQSTFF